MKTYYIILFFLSISVCSKAQQYQNVDAKTFKDLIAKTPKKVIIDVRTNNEVAQGVLKEAIQIDYSSPNFETKLDKLDKNKPVFVYCAAGGRSGKAANILTKKGFKQVYNLDGGITAWQVAGYKTSTLKTD